MSGVGFGFFAFIAFVVIVLFNVGFLTPHWITIQETIASNSTNSSTPSPTIKTCHHGLFYSRDCPESENVFDKTIIGLNIATSVCLTTFPLFWVCIYCITCCGKSDDNECADSCCSLYSFFYASGGLLGLVSAMMVTANYDHDLLGWSFFMTVAATSIILVQNVLLFTYCICTRNTKEKCTLFMVYRRHHNYD
nr:uncharacterized protein LOC105324711 isoform X2 [Crassostrea gigas]